jgi:hypothetical protein
MLLKKGLLALFICWGLVAAAQEGFPVPPVTNDLLFYLQRTPNTNTIICDLNTENGKLDEDDPINVYWIRYQEKGQKEELSFIQRKFAYGIKAKKMESGTYKLHFVSYSKYQMFLMKATDGKYHVYAPVNEKMVILKSIFIKINKGGTFWSPNIEYFEVKGIDPATGTEVMERKKVLK